MKKISKKIITISMAAVMLLPLITVQSSAASSVIISGGDSVKGGDTFYVSVTFNGSDIGRVDAGLSYDTDKLTYISGGTSQGNSGYVQLKLAGTGEAITFNLKFQALQEGKTSVDVQTYEMYDLNERYLSDAPSGSKTINIKGNASEDQILVQETSPDKPEKPTELKGVDEMEEEQGGNVTWILIIGAVILVALIIVIAVVLTKKKK
ncbi:MAG: hypothetical protein Q4F78_04070 [Bacillota bacterium]|nr:hypothetical protein [Bacillota bacterium]